MLFFDTDVLKLYMYRPQTMDFTKLFFKYNFCFWTPKESKDFTKLYIVYILKNLMIENKDMKNSQT
jgi:hypothetical protein